MHSKFTTNIEINKVRIYGFVKIRMCKKAYKCAVFHCFLSLLCL